MGSHPDRFDLSVCTLGSLGFRFLSGGSGDREDGLKSVCFFLGMVLHELQAVENLSLKRLHALLQSEDLSLFFRQI